MSLHEIVSRAADGELPEWAVVSDGRRDHISRVSTLLSEWALSMGLSTVDRTRWIAAGALHDVLRDEDPEVLRTRVSPEAANLPGALLHGPAAAERLRIAGVLDGELLGAISFHTVGDVSLGSMGRSLYAADFLEPGRRFMADFRAALRDRMPGDLDAVVLEIARARITFLAESRSPILPRTVAFWNQLVSEHS